MPGSLIPGQLGSIELEGSILHLTVEDGARVVIEALRALDGGGVVPGTLTVREPSLDDVFLALTGHRAERAATPDAPQEQEAAA